MSVSLNFIGLLVLCQTDTDGTLWIDFYLIANANNLTRSVLFNRPYCLQLKYIWRELERIFVGLREGSVIALPVLVLKPPIPDIPTGRVRPDCILNLALKTGRAFCKA